MSTRPNTLFAAAGLVLVFAGCRLSTLSLNYHEDTYDHRPARVTYVEPHVSHVCTYDCHDHYYDGSRVVVLRSGHRHGRNCGHHWDGRFWIASKIRQARRRANDRHRGPARVTEVGRGSRRGGQKVRVSGPARVAKVRHVHGPSCGHVYKRNGHKWLKVKRGHVHGAGCGHAHIEGRWTIRF